MAVYIIRAGDTEYVKIGRAQDVMRRFWDIQAHNHEPLNIIRLFAGGQYEEKRLHALFREQRLRNEWFKFHPDMLSPLEGLSDLPLSDKDAPVETNKDPILYEIESFLASTGMTASAFGWSATNDPMLVLELRRGRECRAATKSRIRDFLINQQETP